MALFKEKTMLTYSASFGWVTSILMKIQSSVVSKKRYKYQRSGNVTCANKKEVLFSVMKNHVKKWHTIDAQWEPNGILNGMISLSIVLNKHWKSNKCKPFQHLPWQIIEGNLRKRRKSKKKKILKSKKVSYFLFEKCRSKKKRIDCFHWW